MPRLSPAAICLDELERKALAAIVQRHSSPQQLAQRARIIRQAGNAANNRAIARDLGVSRDMVQLWRQRWLTTASKAMSVDERLGDAERPGAPAEFTMEQVLKLFAMACDPPEVYGFRLATGRPVNWPLRPFKKGFSPVFRRGMWDAYWPKRISNHIRASTGSIHLKKRRL
jgi:hypothetical protein